jgi:hypothetical protein
MAEQYSVVFSRHRLDYGYLKDGRLYQSADEQHKFVRVCLRICIVLKDCNACVD